MLKTELKNKNIACIVPKIKINYIIVVKNCEKFEQNPSIFQHIILWKTRKQKKTQTSKNKYPEN